MDTPTHLPQPSSPLLVVWGSDEPVIEAIRAMLDGRVDVIGVASPERLRLELQLADGLGPIVLIDGRGAAAPYLRAISSEDLEGRQVVVWGVPTLDTPELSRVLTDAERTVGCTAEADARDVAELCASLLGA